MYDCVGVYKRLCVCVRAFSSILSHIQVAGHRCLSKTGRSLGCVDPGPDVQSQSHGTTHGLLLSKISCFCRMSSRRRQRIPNTLPACPHSRRMLFYLQTLFRVTSSITYNMTLSVFSQSRHLSGNPRKTWGLMLLKTSNQCSHFRPDPLCLY